MARSKTVATRSNRLAKDLRSSDAAPSTPPAASTPVSAALKPPPPQVSTPKSSNARKNTTPRPSPAQPPITYLSSLGLKSVFLHDWWLVKLADGNGIAVAGLASREREGFSFFRSATIIKNHGTTILEAKDGVIITLTGCINDSPTIENGFSLHVCSRFRLGFPDCWEKYATKDCSGGSGDGAVPMGESRFGEPGMSSAGNADTSLHVSRVDLPVQRLVEESVDQDRGVARKKRETSPLPSPGPQKIIKTDPTTKTSVIEKANGFESKNPFFKVVMGRSYALRDSNLNIPAKFAREYLKEKRGQVILRVPNGRAWTVNYRTVTDAYHTDAYHRTEKTRFCRTRTWDAFIKDNKLKIGDHCVFELVKDINISFQVFIFRRNERVTGS